MGFLWISYQQKMRCWNSLHLSTSNQVVLVTPHLATPTSHEPSVGSHFIVTQAALEKSPLVNTGRAVLAQSPKTRTIAGPQLEGAGEKVAK